MASCPENESSRESGRPDSPRDDLVLFQHEYGFMLALPELALVEFDFHRLAGL